MLKYEELKAQDLVDEMNSKKSANIEEAWLMFKDCLGSFGNSLFKFGFDSKITKENYLVFKEFIAILLQERRLFNFLIRNIGSVDLDVVEDSISMLDDLNEKTYAYYQDILGGIEDALLTGQEHRASRPRKRFDTLIETDSYSKQIIATTLSDDEIRAFLGYEDEFWSFIEGKVIRHNNDISILTEMCYVTPIYDHEFRNMVDIKLLIPEVVDLKTALLTIQLYQKAYRLFKTKGAQNVTFLENQNLESDFENDYMSKRLEQINKGL